MTGWWLYWYSDMALLQLSTVTCEEINSLSFDLEKGQIAVVETAGREIKLMLIDLVLGEKMPENGSIFLQGKPLEDAVPGSIGWVSENGGLINNLKVWENITLPLWYHSKYMPRQAEETVQYWLNALGLDSGMWNDFMSSQPALLKVWERKLAGLLRGLVLNPALLVVDAALFERTARVIVQHWIKALEIFVQQPEEHAVLVIADQATLLPWRKIE